MQSPHQIPESNVDSVAIKLVKDAIVGDIEVILSDTNEPRTSSAQLLELMAKASRNIGRDFRAAHIDWDDSSTRLCNADPTDPDPIITSMSRQDDWGGEVWAQRWMLMHLAKHLYYELERVCLTSSDASVIESIDYEIGSGKVLSWKKTSLTLGQTTRVNDRESVRNGRRVAIELRCVGRLRRR